MKVAIIHNQFNRSGGMETYLLALVQGFNAAGDEVHVHTYKVDRSLLKEFPCRIHKTTVFFLPRRIQKYFFLNKYNRLFNRRDYDLSLSLTRTSCQDLAVVGGVHPESILTAGNRNWYRKLNDRFEIGFERKMFQGVPGIVAHSKLIEHEIHKHYDVDSSKIKVVYPPIDERLFRPFTIEARKAAQKKYGINVDKVTLLFPSLGHKRKGLGNLIAALAELDSSRYELLIAGEQVESTITAGVMVRYLGYSDNMAELYNSVDYTVLPSHYEPFGLVVPESLACGTPVLVSAQVGASELLTEGEGVVVADNDPHTLATAIARLKPERLVAGFAPRNALVIGQHIRSLKNFVRMRVDAET